LYALGGVALDHILQILRARGDWNINTQK